MGCAVTKQEQYRRQRREEEHRLNEYWYDREEHLCTVHEPSSIVDPADLRTDLPQSKEQQCILLGAVTLGDIHVNTCSMVLAPTPAELIMPEKAAKVLLDVDAIRRDSGIDIDSCLGEDEEVGEVEAERAPVEPTQRESSTDEESSHEATLQNLLMESESTS